MALADHVSNDDPSCSVGAILAGQDLNGKHVPAEDVTTLLQWLGSAQRRGDSASVIFDRVKAEGYRISYQQINRHRGGHCSCARRAA